MHGGGTDHVIFIPYLLRDISRGDAAGAWGRSHEIPRPCLVQAILSGALGKPFNPGDRNCSHGHSHGFARDQTKMGQASQNREVDLALLDVCVCYWRHDLFAALSDIPTNTCYSTLIDL